MRQAAQAPREAVSAALDAALPVRRVAAGMKARNHKHGIIFGNEKKRVWKAAQKGAAYDLVNYRKLPGVAAHAFDNSVNCLAEPSP